MHGRRRFAWTAVALLSSLSITGCVSMYKAPDNPALSATLKFFDQHGGPGRGHVYFWQSTQTCEKTPGEGRIAALDWVNGDQKRAIVATGQRRYLMTHRQVLVSMDSGSAGSLGLTSEYCRRLVSFVPEAGHTYRIETGAMPQCDLAIVDEATGLAPSTLQSHEVAGRCAAEDI